MRRESMPPYAGDGYGPRDTGTLGPACSTGATTPSVGYWIHAGCLPLPPLPVGLSRINPNGCTSETSRASTYGCDLSVGYARNKAIPSLFCPLFGGLWPM
jgi:hypothetical protein